VGEHHPLGDPRRLTRVGEGDQIFLGIDVDAERLGRLRQQFGKRGGALCLAEDEDFVDGEVLDGTVSK
jgi:hypothetical protein